MTNGDRIRAMTDEELAYWMYGFLKNLFDGFGKEYIIDKKFVKDAIRFIHNEAEE